jgi:O-antigen/teichoic acid export membrane protein
MTVHNRKATHQIGRSTVINFAGSTLAALVLFLSVPVYLRLVGEIRYGVLTLLWLLLTYLGAIDLGIGRATTNRLASLGKCPAEQTENVFWTALAVCLGSGLVGSVLLYFFSRVLLDHFLSGVPLALRQELGLALPWLVWAPPIITATSVLTGALQGKGAFLALNVGQLAATILYQVTPLVLAMSGYVSLNYLIAGMIGGRLAGAIFLFFLCRTHIPLKSRPSVDVGEIPPLLRYGGWISLTNLAGPLLTVFDRFVIAAQSGAASVTAYTVPFNLVSGLMLLPASLQNALLPRFAALQENEAQRLNVQATVAVMVLMTPAITAFLFLVKPALILWVGQELANRAAPVAHILLLGLWLNAIAFVPFSFLLGRNRPDVPAKFHLLELAPYLLTLWFLVHQFGIVGAAIAWSLRVWVDTMLLFSATGLLQLFIKLSLISITMFAVFNLSTAFAHGLVGYGMSGILTVSLSVLVSVTLLYQQFGPTIFRRETILFFFRQSSSKGNHE